MEAEKRLSQTAEQIRIMESKLCQLEESIDALTSRLAAVIPTPVEEPKVKGEAGGLVKENLVCLAGKIRDMNDRLLLSIDWINTLCSKIEL